MIGVQFNTWVRQSSGSSMHFTCIPSMSAGKVNLRREDGYCMPPKVSSADLGSSADQEILMDSLGPELKEHARTV